MNMTNKISAPKSLWKLSLMCAVTAIMTSCGGSYYERVQSEASVHRPYNCDGLHIKQGVWHYTDSFGQVVDTKGRCYRGMKHGNFDFYVNGIKVATTKYERDAEVNTNCYVQGLQTINLQACMAASARFNNNANNINNGYNANANVPIMRTEPVKKSVWD